MMTFQSRVLLRVSLAEGDAMDLAEALDLVEFRDLDIVFQISEAGEGNSPRLLVEHAPVNEESAYIAFNTPISVDLTTAGTTWFRITEFTRWVRWRSTGTISSSPVVTLDILART